MPTNGESAENQQLGWNGGFDVILGNPPWDQIQFDPREYFAALVPEIARAQRTSTRNQLIRELEKTNNIVYCVYTHDKRINDSTKHILHNSGLLQLTTTGRMNSGPLFSELATSLNLGANTPPRARLIFSLL